MSLVVLGIASSTVFGLLNLRVETTVESFLPEGDPSVSRLEEHAEGFGGNPVVVVLESEEPGHLLLGDKQLEKLMKLEGSLSRVPDVATVYGPGTVMNQLAISSQNLLASLSGTRDGLRARAEAEARNRNESESAVRAAGDAATADFDRRYGTLLVRGLPGGLPTTKNPNFVKNVIFDETGKPRARWHFVVPKENSVAVLVRPREGMDEAATQRLVSGVRDAVGGAGLSTSKVTVTGVPVITSALTAEATAEIPLLAGLAALVILLRFLLASPGSSLFRKLWPLLAAVIGSALTLAGFGLAGVPISFGAAALLPLLMGIGSSFPLYLAASANRRRVLVVSAASAVAFGSLVVSPLPFVRQLGLALGVGVLLTVAVTLFIGRRIGLGPNVEEPVRQAVRSPQRPGVRWSALGCLAAVAVLGWASLATLDVRANPEDVAQGLPELENARYAEQTLGSSGEVSIVLRGQDVRSPQALDWMFKAQDATVSRYGDQIRPILTAPDLLKFLGDHPSPEQVSAGLQLLPPYLTSAVFSPDGRQAVMTFGLKFQDLERQTALLAEMRAALPPPPGATQVDVVGLPVSAARAYELISQHRYLDNLVGIGAAGLVLFFGLRSRRDALRAMAAAALATGWTIAGLWLVGEPLSPLTIALGSLATVTACEFTVLLADEHRHRGVALKRVVGWACATSVVGYLALVPSKIVLLRDFGITLAVTVLLSYLAALAVVRLGPSSAPEKNTVTADEVRGADTELSEVVS
ncbi:MMPL family transporter [Saccharopolyspora endophytica]|uniref:MMPL family transporter n=1 Tax=Saccharopolyspora endophytica TaxID=543886 RepID=A0ABS5DB96_9PSEU|nr:MMPL family transporter [Saccharopolyspora endophytica]MBQ0923537.1 MMPL family transporter [Saccharopolyspora endophytica]